MKKKNAFDYLPCVPFFLLAIFFLLLPLVNTVVESLMDPETKAFSFINYINIFTKPIYLLAVWNSVRIALVATFFGIIISFFTALSISMLGEKALKSFMPIMNLTQNFAGFPLAFAFMLMLGHAGFLNAILKIFGLNYNLYSGNGLIPVFIYFAIPLGTLFLIPGFSAVKKEWKEAATLLNANGAKFWFRIGLPVLAPTILGTTSIVFADSITTYATVYVIMTNYSTMPLKIAAMFSKDATQQTELGSALSLTMIVIILLVMGLTNLLKNKLAKGVEA
jgi:putative spermidine/putrescine transport system permease protein